MVKIIIDETGFKEAISQILDMIANRLKYNMQKNTVEANAVATGEYVRSFDIEKPYDFTRFVGSDCPYAKEVEWGSRPHRPPFEDILKWVEEKKGEHGKEAERAAWRIIRKIEREGTKPKLIVTRSVVDTVRDFGGTAMEIFLRYGKPTTIWRELRTGRFVRGR